MSSELLLVPVSSVRVTKLRQRTAPRMLKMGWRTSQLETPRAICIRLVHDELVFRVLLERDELRPVLREESWVRSSA